MKYKVLQFLVVSRVTELCKAKLVLKVYHILSV